MRNHFLVGALLLITAAGSALSQPLVTPSELTVTLPTGGVLDLTLQIGNPGSEELLGCLDSSDPLQTGRSAEVAVNVMTLDREPCGSPGDIIGWVDTWKQGAIALSMTLDGRLFRVYNDTYEFDYELNVVRSFSTPSPAHGYYSTGMAYVPGSYESDGHLWWAFYRMQQLVIVDFVLIEGDLDGSPTGVSIPIDPGPGGAYEFTWPGTMSFDPTAYVPGLGEVEPSGLFFYIHHPNDLIYAIDFDGGIVPGFPVLATSYANPDLPPPRVTGVGIDAHSGIPPSVSDGDRDHDAALEAFARRGRLEVTVGLPGEGRVSRVVVTDRLGRNVGLETSLMAITDPDDVVVIYDIVRSRIDPNGTIYVLAFLGQYPNRRLEDYAIRPVPLSPLWMDVGLDAEDGWSLSIPAGETVEVPLTLDATWLPPGTYRDTLLVRPADGSEPALVPVTLTVPGTVGVEEGLEPPSAELSRPYPNPARGEAMFLLDLRAAGVVELAVYDVLGRRVETVHEGPLPAGKHPFSIDATHLTPGLYVVRAVGNGFMAGQRVTVVR